MALDPLFHQIKEGETRHVIQMLKDIEFKSIKDLQDKDGNNLLHFACERGDLAIVKALCEKGSAYNFLNKFNKDHHTPLSYAAATSTKASDHTDIVVYLCGIGVSVNSHVKGDIFYTPLMYAAMNCRLPAVQALVARGADVRVIVKYDIDVITCALKNIFGREEAFSIIKYLKGDINLNGIAKSPRSGHATPRTSYTNNARSTTLGSRTPGSPYTISRSRTPGSRSPRSTTAGSRTPRSSVSSVGSKRRSKTRKLRAL